MENKNIKKCPVCGENMVLIIGGGWGYDKYYCIVRACSGEIELETSTYSYNEVLNK